MLKGFIVIFTAVISFFFFKRKFSKLQILGICSVVIGLLLVGCCNIHSYNAKCKFLLNAKLQFLLIVAPYPFLGNSMVIFAQLFLAGMFVYEEKILKEYNVHVFEIVGWEGVWGMLISSLFIIVFYFIPGNDSGSWENPVQATYQVLHNNNLLVSILCSSLVIGPFNYFGTNLTKYSSAMHRCLIDASRMCFVWLISICCGWEHFKLQQSTGYLFVLVGNLIYHEILRLPQYKGNEDIVSIKNDRNDEETTKINSEPSNFKSGSLKNNQKINLLQGFLNYLFFTRKENLKNGFSANTCNEIVISEEKNLLNQP